MVCRREQSPRHRRRKLHAIIWDAGGTLFDTYPAVVSAAQAVIAEFGAELSEERLMTLFRKRTQHALETVAAELSVRPDLLTARFEMAYDAVGAEHQPPFPGVTDVCRYMLDAGGCNFIVTHRGRASLTGLLKAHDMVSLFTECITEEDPYPRKPDPTSTLAVMERYHLEPQRCLVVGDRKLDMVAGSRAGAITCLFGDEEAAAPLADLWVHSYDDLLRWLRVSQADVD